jgi:hypothetical protein
MYIVCLWLVFACNPPVPSDVPVQYTPTDQLFTPGPEDDYNRLLLRHVNRRGEVHYKGLLRDSLALNRYLNWLESAYPMDSVWSESRALAFWINAHNAAVLRMVLRNYPVRSFLDIGIVTPELGTPDYARIAADPPTAYDLPAIRVAGKTLSLRTLRDSVVLGRFREPRALFALSDATLGGPYLRQQAYAAAALNSQLDEAVRNFLFLPGRVQINPNAPQLSALFKWHEAAFGDSPQAVYEFLNAYLPVKIATRATPVYLPYNWLLNEAPQRSS